MNDKTTQQTQKTSKYTCADYREEMRLLGMHQQLKNTTLSESEKKNLQTEIDTLEKKMGLL
jgi:hypothetical protein